MRVPKEIGNKVVSKLYSDAAKFDWAHLSPQQRSAQYNAWIQDPEVGGRLQQYLAAEEARVWIKDGPMKEWSRAVSGVGEYAAFVDDASDFQPRLVRKALGEGWQPRPDTLRIKPLRLVAHKDEEEIMVAWGPATDLKHLMWAALTASAAGDARVWVVCVVSAFTKPTPSNEKQAHQRIAHRCGIRVVHIER